MSQFFSVKLSVNSSKTIFPDSLISAILLSPTSSQLQSHLIKIRMSLIMKKFVDYVFGLELDFEEEPYRVLIWITF